MIIFNMRSCRNWRRLFPLLLLLVPVLIAAKEPDADLDDMYKGVAAYMTDPANHPDLARGVVNIEYGDAKVYGPAWVYLKDKSPPFSATAPELAMADAMIKRYGEYFDRFDAAKLKSLSGDFDTLMHVAIGIEGVFKAYERDPKPEYRELIIRYLDMVKPVAKHPSLIYNYHVQPYGPITVVAGAAWFYLSYPLTFGANDPRSAEYTRIGLDMLKKLDRLYDPKGKKYLYSIRPGYDFTYAYTNMVLVQALVRAYVLTGDKSYYQRGLDITETMDRDLYNPGYQGYLAAEDLGKYYRKYQKIGPQYNQEYMALSAHNYIAYACFALYEAGGFKDEFLIERAERALSFQKRWLWDHKGRIEHHIERGKLADPKDYCGGCNFQTLYNIVLLKHALMKEPALNLAGSGPNRQQR